MARFMRILVFFDLPVKSTKQRKAYINFRRFLIKDGFDMLQYSVYARIVRNYDDANKHIVRINAHLPPEGSVRVLCVTEKQYASMMIMLGEQTAMEKRISDNEIIVL